MMILRLRSKCTEKKFVWVFLFRLEKATGESKGLHK
jgi:hypothetical protein